MPDKQSTFDAYHKWLGIPPEEQPADHYRLLGVHPLESDADVIDAAADRQMAHVQRYQAGPHAALSQRILNEIAAARVCLLDPHKKAAYDQSLRSARAAHQPQTVAAPSIPLAVRMGPPAPPAVHTAPVAVEPAPLVTAVSPRTNKRRASGASPVTIGVVVVAGLLAIAGLVAVLNMVMNAEPKAPLANSGKLSPAPSPPAGTPNPTPDATGTKSAPSPAAPAQDEPPAKQSSTEATSGANTANDSQEHAKKSPAAPSTVEASKAEVSWRRGLVLALSMDQADLFERDGKQLLRDNSGQENHAQLEQVQFLAGVTGEAVRFAAAQQYLQCTDTASLNPVEGLTVAAWIRADDWHEDFAQGSLVSKDDWDQRTTRGYVLRAGGSGKADFTVGGSGWHGASSSGLATGKWHHIAGTYDGRFLRLYLNGSEEARTRIDAKLTPSPYPLRLGNGTFATMRQFLGSIDEAAVWNRALTDEELAEVLKLSAAGKSYCRPQN